MGKKLIIAIIFLFLLFLIPSISSVVVLDSSSDFDIPANGADQALVYDSQGRLYLLASVSDHIILVVSDDNGNTWEYDRDLDIPVDSHFDKANLLINSTDDLIVVGVDDTSPTYSLYSQYSTDRGYTWSTLNTIESGQVYSMSATINSNDNIVICIGDHGTQDIDVFNSSTGGATWHHELSVVSYSNVDPACAITTDHDDIFHMAIYDINGDDVDYIQTSDPENWGTVRTVYSGFSGSQQEIDIATNSTNGVFIATRHPTSNYDLVVFHSDQSGVTWRQENLNMNNQYTTLESVSIVADSNDVIHVFSTSGDDFFNTGSQLRYMNSSDGGDTWTNAFVLQQHSAGIVGANVLGAITPNASQTDGEVIYYSFGSETSDAIYFDKYFIGDTTPPDLELYSPSNNTIFTSLTQTVSHNVSDYGWLSECWWTKDSGDTNTTLTCGDDITQTWSEGITVVDIFANDSFGNENSSSVTFDIQVSPPEITLDYPPNYTFFNNGTDIYLNWTATDLNGIEAVEIWHDFNGSWSLNMTRTDTVSGERAGNSWNVTGDRMYFWNIWANDTTGSGIFNTTNYTLVLDETLPYVGVDVYTTTGSQTIYFNMSVTETNPDSCIYRVDTPEGVEKVANTTLDSCYENDTLFVVTAYATYNLSVYINDTAENHNVTTVQFTAVPQSASSPGGGGGGGGTPATESSIPVVGLVADNTQKEYSSLEKEIVYSRINGFCAEIKDQPTFTTLDLSDQCVLTTVQLNQVLERINSETPFTINADDMIIFYSSYKNTLLFQGFETKQTILKFGLVSAVIGNIDPFRLTPPSIARIPLIFRTSGNATISDIIVGNKQIKGCEIVSETPDLTCELYTNTSIKVTYYIDDVDFTSDVLTGTLAVISEATSDSPEEVRSVSVSYKPYNIVNLLPFISVAITFVLVIFSFALYRIRINIKLSKK